MIVSMIKSLEASIPARFRSYQVSLLDKSGDLTLENIEYKYWLQFAYDNIQPLILKPMSKVEIIFENIICSICHERVDQLDEWSTCTSCRTLQDDSFIIRMKCVFQRLDSALIRNGQCSKTNFPCKIVSNKMKCHSPHLFYFGRFGNLLKVGIIRKQRMGGFLSRILEQGLQEFYIINYISSLPKVLEIEDTFKEMKFKDSISFQEKFVELTSGNFFNTHNFLAELFTEQLLGEYFEETEILYYKFPINFLSPKDYLSRFDSSDKYQFDFHQIIPMGYSSHIYGEILDIIGDLILIRNHDQVKAYQAKQLLNREISSFRLNNEFIVGE
jgi:hypothetical protein